MRKVFIDSLVNMALKDKRIFLLTGDLGFSVLEKFYNEIPDRFYNAGVAEQGMIGTAAGLALTGKIVFVYSIVPFITMRCLEQIRNDLCYQNLNVKLIGIGGGLMYGTSGASHYSIEDVSIMRSLVNMTVICPGDTMELKESVKASIIHNGPVYIRLGKDSGKQIHKSLEFCIGKSILLNQGSDIAIVSSGSMLPVAQQIVNNLLSKNISVSFISMPTIKPLDKKTIVSVGNKIRAIFTIEEHGVIGGLGSAVSEVLCEQHCNVFFEKFALPDEYIKQVGSYAYLIDKYGLTAEKITEKILDSWRKLN